MEKQIETLVPGPVFLRHGRPDSGLSGTSTYKPWLYNKEIYFPWDSKASFPLLLLPAVHAVVEQPQLLPVWSIHDKPLPRLIGVNFGLYQYTSFNRTDNGIVYCNPKDNHDYIYWLHTITHSISKDEWSWFRLVRHLREILGSPIPLL
jgi:hypothetical protein